MNANITEVKIAMGNTTKRISVDENGMILVVCGSGPHAGAYRVKLEDATQVELEAAKEVEDTLSDAAEDNDDKYSVNNSSFDNAVACLAYMRGEKFLELVRYARSHGNSFANSGVSQLEKVANADDAYCSAIIRLTRRLGEAVDKRAFKLFEQAENGNVQDFLDLFGALQVINSLI